MKANRARDTSPERRLRSLLHRRGLRFRVDYSILSRRRADIVFTRRKIAVFIDGCFWHGCPLHGTWPKQNRKFWREKIETNKRRDAETNRLLAEKGWTVLRFWEHEDLEIAASKISRMIEATPSG